MRNVIVCMKGFDEHVINIDLHGLSEFFGEHLIHKSLISCVGVFKAEGHYFVAIGSAICNECNLLAIIRVHHDLVVS